VSFIVLYFIKKNQREKIATQPIATQRKQNAYYNANSIYRYDIKNEIY